MAVSAKFYGACPACEGRWVPGDLILKTEDRWTHFTCPQRRDDDLSVNYPICETCWLSHAEGACDR